MQRAWDSPVSRRLSAQVTTVFKADRVIGGGDIVVYRSGKTDRRDAPDGEVGRAAEGSVAADRDDAVDVVVTAGLYGLCHALFGLELRAAVGVEDRAAETAYVGDVAGSELLQLAADEAGIALHDADDLNSVSVSGKCDGADRRVHAGCVSAGGQDADFSELCHCIYHPFLKIFILIRIPAVLS